MVNENGSNNTVERISNQTKSCCKVEMKYISNSSDFESNNKISKSDISAVFIFTNINQYIYPSYSKVNTKGVLLFFNITNDIPVKYSSLLI
jgi:hypothetical protein